MRRPIKGKKPKVITKHWLWYFSSIAEFLHWCFIEWTERVNYSSHSLWSVGGNLENTLVLQRWFLLVTERNTSCSEYFTMATHLVSGAETGFPSSSLPFVAKTSGEEVYVELHSPNSSEAFQLRMNSWFIFVFQQTWKIWSVYTVSMDTNLF